MEDSEKLVALESEEQKDEALQLAENMEIEQEQKEKMVYEFPSLFLQTLRPADT